MSYIIGSDFYKWLKIFGVPTGGGPPPAGALLAVNNLSDVLNSTTSIENIGLGRPGIQIVNDADFAAGGGTFTLTNPPPIFVVMDATSPGRILKLPPQNQPTSLQGSQNIRLITSNTSDPINIHNGADTLVFQVTPKSAWEAVPNDRTSVAGAWEFLGIVMTINGNKTGDVDLASDPQIVYVAPSGSDVPAENDGSILFPYQTLSYALSQISPSPTSFFQISMAPAIYTETNLVLKPNVVIDGNQSQLEVTGSVTLDTSWSGGGFLYFQGFSELIWPAVVTLDFNSFTPSASSYFKLSDNRIGLNTTLVIVGDAVNGTITEIQSNFGFLGNLAYDLTNCFTIITNGACGNLTIRRTSEAVANNLTVSGMTAIGNFLMTSSTTSATTLFHENSKVIGTTTYQVTGAGILTALAKGNTYFSAPVTNNGTGGGSVDFSSDTLTALPIPLNGATYSPTSIGDAMLANTYFTPTNYIPIDGPPGEWDASSIVGNLAGIDAAIGGATGIPPAFAEMYFQGNTTATTITAANTPVKVNATYSPGLLNEFTHVNGTLTYTGATLRNVQVVANPTVYYSGTAQNTSFYIAKNGVVISKSKQSNFIGVDTDHNKPSPVTALVDLVTSDTLELWIENNDNANDPIVSNLNFNLHSISGFDSGMITLAGENYLSLVGNTLTANPVNLGTTNITGTLPLNKVNEIATSIDTITLQGSSGTGSIALIGSQEQRIGNLVNCTVKISFTSSANSVIINIEKTYGGNFSAIKQACGSGACARTPTPTLGDAQVQSVDAIIGTSRIQLFTRVGTLVQDYILECNFMYEVT